MTRDEFLALPPSIALRVLLEVAPGLVAKLEAVPVPKIPPRPRFDFAIRRKDGTQWASETDLEGLLWWQDFYRKGAAKGGEYAAKDAKRVKQLDAFIAWRRVEPSAQWSGERGDEDVTAAPPSGKPRVHPRQQRGEQSGSGSEASGFEGDASGGDSGPSDFNY